MSYQEAHQVFIQSHINRRSGERRGRLERGHQHAEMLFLQQVWYPLYGHFDDLHPEYEVLDLRGRPYFGDFAYLPGDLKFIWEIKGYGPHVLDMDRKRYCDELNRETFLQALGYRVVSFAYDDVAYRPELCITLLRMLLSRYQPSPSPASVALIAEKEVVRLHLKLARPIRPKDVEEHFSVHHRTAVRLLHSLVDKGWLRPVLRGKGIKIVQYELARGVLDYFD
ncbi:hypothetical protein [Paenibacillus sedimenti]|uniref:DUF559 domain-containing protein n=1 Tax=Paenibacillus sedimenti TaxID=2770274 RepID=A0A926QMK5_9BACL|nr:hypothetical protein [Paenibacillus sedimenti]MBD0383787.1 hypothetical protein [Paenibacillus sedimenti]